MSRFNLTKIAVAAGASTVVAAPVIAAYRLVTRHKAIALVPVTVWLALTYLPPSIVHQKLTAPPAYSQAEHDKATAEAVASAKAAVSAQAKEQIDELAKSNAYLKELATHEQGNSARVIKERADAEAKVKRLEAERQKQAAVPNRNAWGAGDQVVAENRSPKRNYDEVVCNGYRAAEQRYISSISQGYTSWIPNLKQARAEIARSC